MSQFITNRLIFEECFDPDLSCRRRLRHHRHRDRLLHGRPRSQVNILIILVLMTVFFL